MPGVVSLVRRGRKWWLPVLAAILCAGVAGFFVLRPLWPTVGPTPEEERQSHKTSTEHGQLQGDEQRPVASEGSAPEPGPARETAIEDLKREATEVADQLMRDFPDNPDAISVMAMVHHRFGDTAGVVKCLERCLQVDPHFTDAYYGMASVALKTGDYEKAAALSRRALEIDSTLLGAAEQLADALMGLGKFEEAVAVLENDAKVLPKTAGMLSRLGAAYHSLEEYEKAKENHQAAIELDPALADAYYGLAKACAKLGQRDESSVYLQKYKELADHDRKTRIEGARTSGDLVLVRQAVADVYTAAGQVYRKHGNVPNAEGHWLKAARLASGDTVCRNALVSLYRQMNRTAETLQILGQLAEIEPENATYQMQIGGLNARLDQFDAAERAFRKVSELAPKRPEGYLALARLHLESNRKLLEAMDLARTAVELAPTPANYVLLSAACKRNGDHAGAVSAIQRAIELDPSNEQYRRIQESLREKP
ncbi:MAG: tetratricopeptide repeat protein [Planctomycetota bacterium]